MCSYGKSTNDIIEMLQNYQASQNSYNNQKFKQRHFLTQHQHEQSQTQQQQEQQQEVNLSVVENRNLQNSVQKKLITNMANSTNVTNQATTSSNLSSSSLRPHLLSCQASTSYSMPNLSPMPFVSSSFLAPKPLNPLIMPNHSLPSTSCSLSTMIQTSTNLMNYNQQQHQNSQVSLLYQNLNHKSQYFTEVIETDRNLKMNDLIPHTLSENHNELLLERNSYNDRYLSKESSIDSMPNYKNRRLMLNLNHDQNQQQQHQNLPQVWNSERQVNLPLNHTMCPENRFLTEELITSYEKSDHPLNSLNIPQSMDYHTQFRMS